MRVQAQTFPESPDHENLSTLFGLRGIFFFVEEKAQQVSPDSEAMDLSKLGDLMRKTQSAILEKERLIKGMDDIQSVSAPNETRSTASLLYRTLGGVVCAGRGCVLRCDFSSCHCLDSVCI